MIRLKRASLPKGNINYKGTFYKFDPLLSIKGLQGREFKEDELIELKVPNPKDIRYAGLHGGTYDPSIYYFTKLK